MTTPAPIMVGRIGSIFWMRVEGKGSFQNSVQVKSCFHEMMSEGTRHFVVDLERCPIMDSTFLGTLTGAALSLRETGGGNVTILNANARNQQLMKSLGLDHILEVDRDGNLLLAERKEVRRELETCADALGATIKDDQAVHVLEAHESLTKANPENACRFRDVIEFLEKEVRAKQATMA